MCKFKIILLKLNIHIHILYITKILKFLKLKIVYNLSFSFLIKYFNNTFNTFIYKRIIIINC